jgi:replicative DNA helicase
VRGLVTDWKKLEQAAVRIGVIPIYRIGTALTRPEDYPELYLANIIAAIEHLRDKLFDWHPQIAAIFVDYLQALPFDPKHRTPGEYQRRLQIRDDIYGLRHMALLFDCPIVVAVQAKQHLDGAPSDKFYMPGVYDGEESSSIAQRSDRVLTLWLPKQTHALGTRVDYNGISFVIEDNLFFIKVAKQRGGLPSGKLWKCRIDYQKNTIAPEI